MWNHWETSSERTNNRLEGKHNRINRLADKPHLNIYQLIDLFKKEDGAAIVTLQQIQTAKKKIWERNDNRIRRLKDRFSSGLISLGDFLSAVGQMSGL